MPDSSGARREAYGASVNQTEARNGSAWKSSKRQCGSTVPSSPISQIAFCRSMIAHHSATFPQSRTCGERGSSLSINGSTSDVFFRFGFGGLDAVAVEWSRNVPMLKPFEPGPTRQQ
jgi:hypothetical protein